MDLKPCPFCAKLVELKRHAEHDTWESMPGWKLSNLYRVVRIACQCGAVMEQRFKEATIAPDGTEHRHVSETYQGVIEEELVKAWNRRKLKTK